MRFVHSSDLLVGLDFSHVAEKAEELRAQRLMTVRSLVQLAASKRAQFILLSGNTLAHPRVSREQRQALLGILRESKLPIYMLPGLHDPLRGASPYFQDAGWRTAPLFLLESVQQLEDCVLVPLFGETHHLEASSLCRIAVGCWTPEQIPAHFEPHHFDYIAMGGSTRPKEDDSGSWPGTPEPTQWSDLQGKVNLVTWDPQARTVKVQPQKVGTYTWSERSESARDLEKLRVDLEGIHNPAQQLLRLTIKGYLSELELVQLEVVLQAATQRFYHFEADHQANLRETPEDRYRNSLLRALSQRVRVHMNEQPEVARQALLELRHIVSQSGSLELE